MKEKAGKYIKNSFKIFLILLAIMSIILLSSISNAYIEKYNDEKNTEAYDKYKFKINIGVNIDYDNFGYFGERIVDRYDLDFDIGFFWTQEKQVELLEELYDMGFRQFRINFKWRDLTRNGEEIDFSKIDKLLSFFESKDDISINACFGPFKNFRYPEQYIYDDYAKKFLNPHEINRIEKDSELAVLGRKYLRNLLEGLQNNFPKFTTQVKKFQANNEPFHPFGNISVYSTYETEYEFIKLVESYFPNQTITFNTPLSPLPTKLQQLFSPDIEDVRNFLIFLENKDPELIYKLNLGINYYSSIGQGLERTPISDVDSVTGARFFADIKRVPTYDEFNNFLIYISKKYQRENSGFELSIAEIQEETWNSQFTGTEPGKSVDLTKKNITRVISYFQRIYNFKQIDIEIWGAEQMAIYSYLNKNIGIQNSVFVENASKNKEVINYYINNFRQY